MFTLCAAYTPPFPYGTASGHIMYTGNDPPAVAGRKRVISTVILGILTKRKGLLNLVLTARFYIPLFLFYSVYIYIFHNITPCLRVILCIKFMRYLNVFMPHKLSHHLNIHSILQKSASECTSQCVRP